MNVPSFTIIIPHYNSPTLLRRCLASIPDCEDIQVIVVDDCSDPNIVDFNTIPGRERLNTEFYRTPQGGSAGRARNIGLEHAKGKWLLFADSDDFFTTTAFDTFKQHCEDEADIIFFGIESRDSETLERANRCSFINDLVQNLYIYPSKRTETDIRLKHMVPWGKMIRHTLISTHAIQFDEVRYSNDTMFSAHAGLSASLINVDSVICYCVTVSANSLTTSISKHAFITRIEVIMRRNRLFRETEHADYQTPLAYYLITAAKFGFSTLVQVLRMGIKYKANFFVGMSHWPKSLLCVILRKQTEIAPWQK